MTNLIKKGDLKTNKKLMWKDLIKWLIKNKQAQAISYFENIFSFQGPSKILEAAYNTNYRKEKQLFNKWDYKRIEWFKNVKLKKISEAETEIEKPDKTLNIVEKILEFNIQSQEGQGSKLLTPD